MEKIIYDVLNKLEENSYESYIVGGYVRDFLLGINSYDIDITTNAKPKEVLEIFKCDSLKLYDYGNVSFEKDNYTFEITTFRKDIKYINNRKPEKIVYIDSFEEDLERRDFTINAICMDKEGNIIDLHNGRKDLKRKIIRTIGDPDKKLKEDALRILRAIRFATVFRFKLDLDLKNAIIKHKELLRTLSYERKKEELNKIFCSKNKKYGIKLLTTLGLLEPLELKDIHNVLYTNDLTGIWAMITDHDYAFTKNEKELTKKIRDLMGEDINNPIIQYKYGAYALSVVSDLKKLNTKKIIAKYEKLPIKDRNEISINAEEICETLNRKPDSFLKDIIEDIETLILKGLIKNDKEVIKEYIKNNY